MTDATDTDTSTAPQPLSGPQIRDLVCARLEIDPDEFVRRARLARWPAPRFREELELEGWESRFAADLAAETERRVRLRMARALRYGPVALGELTGPELLRRVDARLRPLAEGLRPEHGGRLITGPTGTGKTSALVAVTRRLLAEQRDLPELTVEQQFDGVEPYDEFLWVRAMDLPVARLELALGRGEAELVAKAKRVDVLLLDDLGWESGRAGADSVIAELLAHRYDAGLISWATSGMRIEQLAERYSDAMVRRICEAGGKAGKVVDLWGKSTAPRSGTRPAGGPPQRSYTDPFANAEIITAESGADS